VKPVAGPVVIPERYELKYTIPAHRVADISAFVEPYCSLDYHSSISPDNFYQVNSLYFDSPDFVLLRNRLGGVHDRFNMRVRTYGAQPQEPWFLEVKRKVGDIIRKYRARVKEGDLARILDPGVDVGPYLKGPGDAKNAELFRRLAHAYNAVPVVQTTYKRKAYFSTCDDYARVTFDKGLRYQARDTYDPLPVEAGFAPTDLETIFDEFVRGSMAEPDGGTGLGLSSVRQLVSLQGGTVSIDSEPGVGTTVTVELPLGPALDGWEPDTTDPVPPG